MSILDRKFKYRPSYDTDVGRHLRKFKRQAAADRKQAKTTERPSPAKVAAIGGRRTS
jgi:hypothetical protein